MIEAPAIATRSSPPSTDCRNTVEVGPPIWIEFDSTAAGMFELMPISSISASRPCFLKIPSSAATIADAQSDVAVQPIRIFWAWALPDSTTPATAASPIHHFLMHPSLAAILIARLLFIDIIFDHIFFERTRGDVT